MELFAYKRYFHPTIPSSHLTFSGQISFLFFFFSFGVEWSGIGGGGSKSVRVRNQVSLILKMNFAFSEIIENINHNQFLFPPAHATTKD